MRNRLPVNIENMELPVDEYENKIVRSNKSSGYVNVLVLMSVLTTAASIITIIVLGNR